MIVFVAFLAVAQTLHEHAALKGHNSQVSSVSFSFDNQTIATGSSDHTIKIWDVATAKERLTLRGHESAILSARFSDKDSTLTSIDYRGKMISWDRIDGVYRPSEPSTLRDVGDIFYFDQQNFGKFAVISSTNYNYDQKKMARIPYWIISSLNTTDPKNAISSKHDAHITSVAISPDGSFASFGDGRGVIRVFSRNDRGSLLETSSFTCPTHKSGNPITPTAIAFHPRNKFLAFGCDDGMIRLWKWSDAAPYSTLAGHTKWVDHIAIPTIGDFVASGSRDLTLKIWSTKTQEIMQSINIDSYMCSISLSNNSNYICAGMYDNTSKIWSIDP